MRNKALVFILLLFAAFSFSQETETIVLKKGQISLYQGISQEIEHWYLYIDEEGIYYLANLEIPENEIEKWFRDRKNSDNIFRGELQNTMYPTLILTKENEQETYLQFYFKKGSEGTIILSSIEDALSYTFKKK